MAKGLTARQQAILQFVVDYLQEEGYPPSIREIGSHFEIGSLRGVTVHLDALERKGYISRANTPRSIKVIHPDFQQATNAVMLPLLGGIAAGATIDTGHSVFDASQAEAMIPVPAEMVRNIRNAFLLRIRGDSMTGEGIMPRDLVVIKPQKVGSHGELVAVRIGDEATVKRLHLDPSGAKLISANPAYDPIIVDREDTEVIGRVVGVIRDYGGMAF